MVVQFDEYQIVPKHQPFDPDTEDLIFGEYLNEGDIVLVEAKYRTYEESLSAVDGRLKQDLLTTNRWCMVTRLRRVEDVETKAKTVYFIGRYEDGMKAVRQSTYTTGWHVKLKKEKEQR